MDREEERSQASAILATPLFHEVLDKRIELLLDRAMHLAPQLTDSGEYISALSEARALRHLRRELERLAAEAESNPVERNFV